MAKLSGLNYAHNAQCEASSALMHSYVVTCVK